MKLKQNKVVALILMGLIFIGIAGFKYKTSEKTDYLVTITTDFGVMKALLYDDTPIHKKNFITLAAEGKYDGSIFHRVINNFMIQGGGLPSPYHEYYDTLPMEKKTLPNEIMEKHKHKFGAIAAARTNNPQKRSDISQFYIVQNHAGTHHLDNGYTVFGQVVVGFDVIDKIAQQPVKGSSPVKPIKMVIKVEKVKRSDIEKFYGKVY